MKKAILVMLSLLAIALLVVGCTPIEISEDTSDDSALAGEAVTSKINPASTPTNACTRCDNTFRTAFNAYITCRGTCGAAAGTTGGNTPTIISTSATIITNANAALANADTVQTDTTIALGGSNQAYTGIITTTATPTAPQKAENTRLICAAYNTAKLREIAELLPVIVRITESIAELNDLKRELNILRDSYGGNSVNPEIAGLIDRTTLRIAELEAIKSTVLSTIQGFDTWPRNLYVCTDQNHYAKFNANCGANPRTTDISGSLRTCGAGKVCLAKHVYLSEAEVCLQWNA